MPQRRVRGYPRSVALRLCLHHDFRIGERRRGSGSRVTAVRTSIAGRAYRRACGTPSVRVMTRSGTTLLGAGESLASSSIRGFAIASSRSMSPLAPSAMMAARITAVSFATETTARSTSDDGISGAGRRRMCLWALRDDGRRDRAPYESDDQYHYLEHSFPLCPPWERANRTSLKPYSTLTAFDGRIGCEPGAGEKLRSVGGSNRPRYTRLARSGYGRRGVEALAAHGASSSSRLAPPRPITPL
jgi:hypothetical protein